MPYKQLKDANMNTPYVGGWCEGFVAGLWRQSTLPTLQNQTTSGTWPSAMAKWNANPGNGNHPGELPPIGKTVPVYFSLGNVPDGHTAASLDDGGVASSSLPGFHTSPYYYKNLNACIADYGKYNGGCTYLGWSGYVGKIQVIAWENTNATEAQVRQAYLDILEREADIDGIQHYMNYPNDVVRADLMASAERARLLANKAATEQTRLAQVEADRIAAEKKAQELAAAQAAQEAAAKAKAEADRLAELARIEAENALELARIAEQARLAAIAEAKRLADEKLAADAALKAVENSENMAFITRLKGVLLALVAWLNKLIKGN